MRWNRFRRPLFVFALTIAVALVCMIPYRGQQPAEAADPVPVPKAAGKSTSQAPATSPNDAELRKTVADYVAAIGKCDLDRIASYWAKDAEYTADDGTATNGRSAIAGLFKECLPEMKGRKVTGAVKSIRIIHPDVAIVEGTIDYADPDGSKDQSHYSAIWVKTYGKWVMSSARDLPVEAAAGPSLASSHLQPLEWMVGDWVDQSPTGEVQMSCHWGSNKAFLLMNFQVKREGQDPIAVAVRVGWDPQNSTIRSWVFDSQGGFAQGTWTRNGHRWLVDTSGVLPDGGTGSSVNTWEYVDGRSFVWRSIDRLVDDQPISDVEVQFVRKADKPKEAKQ
jgi:uncharacterized protein (TIGR02246 family)